MLDSIPLERQVAVQTAIDSTFPAAQIGKITQLYGGGSSSALYKVFINQRPYVVRVMGLDQPLEDRLTQVICFKKAAQLNIAPHCYYADGNDKTGVVIMDYIATQAIKDQTLFLQDLAKLLRYLHSEMELPPVYITTFDYMSSVERELRQYSLPNFISDYLYLINEIKTWLIPHLTKTACHNDLNFSNILFDSKKIWLIDWEAAGQDDPMLDLANVCNQLTFNQNMADTFLLAYFGKALNNYQRAKLFLMEQVIHGYYAVHFLKYAAEGGKAIIDFNVPTLYEWHNGYKNGNYTFTSTEDFLLYGMVQVKASLLKINSAEFIEAKNNILSC